MCVFHHNNVRLTNAHIVAFVNSYDLDAFFFPFLFSTEHITIPITLPRNPLFAQPMFLRVVDTRLGGYNKPVVANGVVKLDTKIPDTLENPNPNYIPPGTQVFISPEESAVAAKADIQVETDGLVVHEGQGDNEGSNMDDVRSSLIENSDDAAKKKSMDKTVKSIQEQMNTRNQALKDDKSIATLDPVDMHAFITERQHKEDTGDFFIDFI